MKKVKMIITSVLVLAIIGSAFAFNAKKLGKFCVTTSGGTGGCYTISASKKTNNTGIMLKHVECWDGGVCNSASPCTTLATFTND